MVGHIRRLERIGKAHRDGWETRDLRDIKKLTGKTSWYKNKPTTQTNTRSRTSKTQESKNTSHSTKEMQAASTKEMQPSSVLFVGRTPGGDLVKMIKQGENNLNKLSSAEDLLKEGFC